MAAINIEMTVKRHTDTVAVVSIHGDVTAECGPVLTQSWDEASVPPTRAVVLDFSDLSYMNSSGIGMLVTVLVRANRSKQKLLASGLTDHYRQIFSLTRLDEAIGIYDDESAVLTAAEAI